jgi:hypothetical protein
MNGTRALLLALALALAGCNAADVILYAAADAGMEGGSAGAGGSATGDSAGSGGDGGTGGTSGAVLGGLAGAGGASGLVGESGAPGDGSMHCMTNLDCPSTWFCSKADCANTSGSCAPRPIFCDANALPVCGCDHVTYWNSCVRQDFGVSAEHAGECGAIGTICTTNADCGAAGVTCEQLLLPPMDDCAEPGLGTCWATPNDCGMTTENRRWLACSEPGIGSPASCVTTCDAIQSGKRYTPEPRGTQCD